jgi:TetR/AcrR family transcriptional repressor of nem operon
MRKKAFDPQAALHHATMAFWSKGYEATSLAELQAAMGIRRQSLYDTYRNKHSLFLESLRYYHQHVIVRNFAPLFDAASPTQAIRDYFARRLADMDNPEVIDGCLITNTVAELGVWDAAIRGQTLETLEYMEKAFYTAVKRAQRLHEIDAGKDAQLIAILLLNNAQGLFVMGKSGMGRDKLERLTAQFLTILD